MEHDVILLMTSTNFITLEKSPRGIVGRELRARAVKEAEKSFPAPEDVAAAPGVIPVAALGGDDDSMDEGVLPAESHGISQSRSGFSSQKSHTLSQHLGVLQFLLSRPEGMEEGRNHDLGLTKLSHPPENCGGVVGLNPVSLCHFPEESLWN